VVAGPERDSARVAARARAAGAAGAAGSRSLNIRPPEKALAAAHAKISMMTFLFR